MNVLSPKLAESKGDSGSPISSSAQDCKTVTLWLAHERCAKAVKASYSSIVLALENMKHHMSQKLLD